jgi:O-antigen/teichoic acid export membrane protein
VVVGAASGSAAAGLAAFVVAELAADAVYWLAARGEVRAPGPGAAATLRPLLTRSWPVALSSIAIYSYVANLDTIILAASRSESEAGVYSAAYRIYLAANIVGIFAAYAAFPRLSRVSGLQRIETLIERLRPTLDLLVCYGVVTVGFAMLAGREALQLFFGDRFGTAGDTFTLLCLSTAWYCVGYPVGYNLIAAERNRRFLAGALTGAGLNLGIDLVLIPRVGMIGAGVATAISIVGATVVWLGVSGVLSRVARPVLAAALVSSGVAITSLLAEHSGRALGAITVLAGLAAATVVLVRRRGETGVRG